MKEQHKNPPDEINEEEIEKLPAKRIQHNDIKDSQIFKNRIRENARII